MKLPYINFSKRPAHTFIYITQAKTFRLDTNGKGEIVSDLEELEFPCDTANALPTVLEALIEKSEDRLGRKIWLFYSRLNSHLLSLPSVQLAGVERDVLEHALQFEYEALSGQSLTKSQLSYRFVSSAEEMDNYWINIVAKETLTRLLEISKHAGCRFGGLMHPGGLPEMLGGDAPSWLRIECWPDTKFALSKNPDSGFGLQVLHIAENAQWEQQLDHWILEAGRVDQSETLLSGTIEYMAGSGDIYRLVDNDHLILWLHRWAKHLILKGGGDVPLLQQTSKINREILYMAASGIGALLLCSGHFVWNLYQETHYTNEFNRLTQTQKDVDAMRKSMLQSRKKVSELENQLSVLGGNIEIIPKAISALQKRPAELLLALSRHSPEDLVIEKIQIKGERLVVSGVSLYPELANQLANRIEEGLHSVAWRVHSPTKQDMDLFTEGGPWSFDMELEDLGLKGFISG